jgi:hypothetical protein
MTASPDLDAEPQLQLDAVYEEVLQRFQARDAALGKTLFSRHDWARTRIAFDILAPARTVVDIGIGQGQLVNLLGACPRVERVQGVDFRRHSKLIEPESAKFSFHQWDITRPQEAPLEPADVVVAMEILEHVAVEEFGAALRRIRALSCSRSVLVTVPWRERAPLYHHDKPHGHQQSFDDARIEELFEGRMLYSDYLEKWYFVFLTDGPRRVEKLPLNTFCARARETLSDAL